MALIQINKEKYEEEIKPVLDKAELKAELIIKRIQFLLRVLPTDFIARDSAITAETKAYDVMAEIRNLKTKLQTKIDQIDDFGFEYVEYATADLNMGLGFENAETTEANSKKYSPVSAEYIDFIKDYFSNDTKDIVDMYYYTFAQDVTVDDNGNILIGGKKTGINGKSYCTTYTKDGNPTKFLKICGKETDIMVDDNLNNIVAVREEAGDFIITYKIGEEEVTIDTGITFPKTFYYKSEENFFYIWSKSKKIAPPPVDDDELWIIIKNFYNKKYGAGTLNDADRRYIIHYLQEMMNCMETDLEEIINLAGNRNTSYLVNGKIKEFKKIYGLTYDGEFLVLLEMMKSTDEKMERGIYNIKYKLTASPNTGLSTADFSLFLENFDSQDGYNFYGANQGFQKLAFEFSFTSDQLKELIAVAEEHQIGTKHSSKLKKGEDLDNLVNKLQSTLVYGGTIKTSYFPEIYNLMIIAAAEDNKKLLEKYPNLFETKNGMEAILKPVEDNDNNKNLTEEEKKSDEALMNMINSLLNWEDEKWKETSYIEKIKIISTIDSTAGVCQIASPANFILEHYVNKYNGCAYIDKNGKKYGPGMDSVFAAFKDDFGYDIYVLDGYGNKVLNLGPLILDMYCFVNTNFKNENDKNIITYTKDNGYKLNAVEDYSRYSTVSGPMNADGKKTESDDTRINSFLKYKGVDFVFDYDVHSYSTSDKDNINEIKEKIRKGLENEKHMALTNPNYDSKNGEHLLLRSLGNQSNNKLDGAHQMTITGMTEDSIIIDSWGKKYYVTFDDLKKVDFYISEVESKEISSFLNFNFM